MGVNFAPVLCSWKNLCQKWSGDTGNTANRLPAHRPDMPNHEPRGCPRGAEVTLSISQR